MNRPSPPGRHFLVATRTGPSFLGVGPFHVRGQVTLGGEGFLAFLTAPGSMVLVDEADVVG